MRRDDEERAQYLGLMVALNVLVLFHCFQFQIFLKDFQR